MNSTKIYNPNTNSASIAANMTIKRGGHTATLLTNGKVFIAGGRDTANFLNTAQLYDPNNNTWSNAGMPTRRTNHTATLLTNGKVLVVGGNNAGGRLNSVELYDPPLTPGALAPT